ncbi:MAG: hypothetical protein EOP81_06310 [Variovorax sp.]|nr:MAG: hypothetical protein EOP81_06310 [Variovorax sp.]
MRNSIRASLCAVLVSLLAGCGGGGDGGGGVGFPIFPGAGGGTGNPTTPTTPDTPTTPPASTSAVVSGKVSNAAGAPVEGFIVSAGGQSTTTGADGSYSLNLASPAASTVLLAARSGYQTMAKQVGLIAGVTTPQNITAYPEGVRTTFPAANGKIVIVNGAVIDIPANAIKDAAGNPYTGVVTISASYNNPTTAAGNDAFPQPYAGLDGGNEVTLQSLGVIEAKLFAADGSPLQLSQPAKLVYPGVDSISTAATIPLWYYDEAKMTWVREGDATRDARDGSYSGSVSHFTQWNLDVPYGAGYSSANITVCVNFAGGEAARYGIAASLRGPGFARNLFFHPLHSGNFDLARAPVGQALTLTFTDASGAAAVSVPVPALANGDSVSLPCVTVTGTAGPVPPQPPEPPVPVDPNGSASSFAGAYSMEFQTTIEVHQGSLDLTVSSAGQITGTGAGFIDSDADTYPLALTSGQVAAGGYVTMTGAGSPAGPLVFTGRFEFVGRGPSGTWEYEVEPAGTTGIRTFIGL